MIRDTTEAIWAATGAILSLILSIGCAALIRQVRHNSTASSQAERWGNAANIVRGFLDGDATMTARFVKMLRHSDMTEIIIETLSNTARAIPESAAVLRGRDDDMEVVRQWVAKALENDDEGRRSHACEVVATLRLRSCLGLVLAATQDPSSNVKVSACRALAVLSPTDAVGVLLGLLETEGVWSAELLVDLCQRIPDQANDAVLARIRDWGVTPALVKMLMQHPSPAANDILLSALDSADTELRARIADAIAAVGAPAISALAGLLSDPNETVRLNAVRSLGRSDSPDALMMLSGAVSDASRIVRFAAASGIASTDSGRGVLERMLEGSDPNAREAAELALWRLATDATDASDASDRAEAAMAQRARTAQAVLDREGELEPGSNAWLEQLVSSDDPNTGANGGAWLEQLVRAEPAAGGSDGTAWLDLVSIPESPAAKPAGTKSAVKKPAVKKVAVKKVAVKKVAVKKPAAERAVKKPAVKKPAVKKPAAERAVEPAVKSTAKPAAKGVAAKTAAKGTLRPVVVRPVKSEVQPAAKITVKPAVKNSAQPVVKNNVKGTAKATVHASTTTSSATKVVVSKPAKQPSSKIVASKVVASKVVTSQAVASKVVALKPGKPSATKVVDPKPAKPSTKTSKAVTATAATVTSVATVPVKARVQNSSVKVNKTVTTAKPATTAKPVTIAKPAMSTKPANAKKSAVATKPATATKPASAKTTVTVKAAASAPTSKPKRTSAKNVAVRAEQLLSANSAVAASGELRRVQQWLVELLLATDGVAPAPAIKTAAAAQGISERTLERARPAIAISVRRGFGEGALWQLTGV